MTDEIQNDAQFGATDAETGPSFTVEKIYVKDLSLEVPGAPAVFNEQAQPQLQMNLNQQVTRLNDAAFEVVLGITLTCTADEKPLYLAGFDAATLDAMLGTHCPNVLYPYARQLISDLIQAGGFPPFLLQPINFDALYAEGLRQRAQQAQGQLGSAEAAGTA
jgi:preprotein translocase subunit SecB